MFICLKSEEKCVRVKEWTTVCICASLFNLFYNIFGVVDYLANPFWGFRTVYHLGNCKDNEKWNKRSSFYLSVFSWIVLIPKMKVHWKRIIYILDVLLYRMFNYGTWMGKSTECTCAILILVSPDQYQIRILPPFSPQFSHQLSPVNPTTASSWTATHATSEKCYLPSSTYTIFRCPRLASVIMTDREDIIRFCSPGSWPRMAAAFEFAISQQLGKHFSVAPLVSHSNRIWMQVVLIDMTQILRIKTGHKLL